MEPKRHMLYRCATGTNNFTAEHSQFAVLEPKADALARVSALLALGAPAVSYCGAITRALNAGASREDVVATLISVSPIIGLARVVSAAPAIALAMGYDIDAALQRCVFYPTVQAAVDAVR